MAGYDNVIKSIYKSTAGAIDYSNEEYLSKRLGDIDTDAKVLEAEKQIILRKALESESPQLLVKAQSYLENMIQDRVRAEGGSAVVMDPDISHYSKGGYITKRYSMSPDYLRKMAQTPIIKSIITTRQTQVSRFSRPQGDKYEYGFKIQKRPKFYTKESDEVTPADENQIEYLTRFILNCGDSKDNWGTDSFDTFLQKITEDSLVLDTGVFELIERRSGKLYAFQAVDAGTIYRADMDENGNYAARTGEMPQQIRGYYPSHVQVIRDRIVADWYPWELCYGIRNARTDITQNGYGRSELEDMVSIITSLLNTEKYNSNFFTQGSNPKGILKMPSGANRNRVSELRQEWMSMVAGVNNAWKIPILEGDGIEWLDLQKTNSDMEFSAWQEYLIRVTCAIYKIAPEEIGFYLSSGGGAMFEGDREQRVKYSKDKGLLPLLKSIEFWINKWIISQIDDNFEFKFVGMDVEDEDAETERDIKLASSIMGLKEVRVKRGLSPEIEEDDMILNQQWIQYKTQQQFGDEQGMNQEAIDEEEEDIWGSLINEGEGEEVVKGLLHEHRDNPLMKDAFLQLQKALKKDELSK